MTNHTKHMYLLAEVEPKFTKEKQLDIICLIGKYIDYRHYYDNDYNEWYCCADQNPHPVYWSYLCTNKDFSKALAELVCQLIEDKVLNKDEVKGVLE